MANVLIVAYLLIVLALIAVILIQRSEGGGLGMGTSSAGLLTVRGSANILTRTTAILATLFFATAIGLTILAEIDRGSGSILDRAADDIGQGVDGGGGITVLDALEALDSDVPSAPVGDEPAASTPATTAPAEAAPAAENDTTQTPAEGAPASETTPAAPLN